MDETYEVKLKKKTELWRMLAFFAWFTGGALGIWLLGIVITLPLLIFFYARVWGALRILAENEVAAWNILRLRDCRNPVKSSNRPMGHGG